MCITITTQSRGAAVIASVSSSQNIFYILQLINIGIVIDSNLTIWTQTNGAVTPAPVYIGFNQILIEKMQ